MTLKIYDPQIKNYFLSFSSSRGHCIELSLLLEKDDDFLIIGGKLGEIFSFFVQKNPSKNDNKIEADSLAFFLNYPNNSIHYGIFDYKPTSYAGESIIDYQSKLSNLIIIIYNEFKEDFHENTNEILINLYLIFFERLGLSLDEAIKFLSHLLAASQKKFNRINFKKAIKISELNFEQNCQELLKYVDSAFYSMDNSEMNEMWKTYWANLIDEFKSKIFFYSSNELENLNYSAILEMASKFDLDAQIGSIHLLLSTMLELKSRKNLTS